MRLLNARSFKIEEFHGDAVPDYAILSHTWGREEISFADYHNPKYTSLSWNTRLKAGWRKIKHACEEASRRKFDYVWIDTCCIDKTSSAELSEAINSMAGWYRRAGVCIVYLVDYAQDEESGVVFDRFKRCRWFTRGWALQELIFPKFVEFYDSEWQHIGNKLDLMSQIREITKIDQRVLVDAAVLPSICVARKMSWAANRQTTRTEDTAYCLMGIFDVNMPLLYGEGRKAFQRLQEEILKKSNDFSILLWHPSLSSNDREEIITEYDHNRYTSILADSPACFSAGSSLVVYEDAENFELTMSNAGLRIVAPVVDIGSKKRNSSTMFVVLPCHYEYDYRGPVGIEVHASPKNDTSTKNSPNGPIVVTRTRDRNHRDPSEVIHHRMASKLTEKAEVRTLLLTSRKQTNSPLFAFRAAILLTTYPAFNRVFRLTSAMPKESWNSAIGVMRIPTDFAAGDNDKEHTSCFHWNCEDGLTSLELYISATMRERANTVHGFFSIAMGSDVSQSAMEPSFQSSQQDAGHNSAVQTSQVCGDRTIVLSFKTDQIMGDLVCRVYVALNSEVPEHPEVFSEEALLQTATQLDRIEVDGFIRK
jgi:hypothetical protein